MQIKRSLAAAFLVASLLYIYLCFLAALYDATASKPLFPDSLGWPLGLLLLALWFSGAPCLLGIAFVEWRCRVPDSSTCFCTGALLGLFPGLLLAFASGMSSFTMSIMMTGGIAGSATAFLYYMVRTSLFPSAGARRVFLVRWEFATAILIVFSVAGLHIALALMTLGPLIFDQIRGLIATGHLDESILYLMPLLAMPVFLGAEALLRRTNQWRSATKASLLGALLVGLMLVLLIQALPMDGIGPLHSITTSLAVGFLSFGHYRLLLRESPQVARSGVHP